MRAATAAAAALARRVGHTAVSPSEAALRAATTSSSASGRRLLSTTSSPAAADGDLPRTSSTSWLPAWARSRLPVALGGDPSFDTELTLDAWATQIKRARQLAAAGQAIGGAARASADPQAQGNLRLYERVVAAMEPGHRADPSTFDAPARAAVAASAGVSVAQVDDTMAKFNATRDMMALLASRRAAGQSMPSSVEEMEGMVAEWRRAKSGASGGSGGGGGGCPFAGRAAPPGRNAVCGRTGKKWKNCCGRQ